MLEKIILISEFIKVRYLLKFSDRNKLENYQNKRLKKHFKFVSIHSKYFKDKLSLDKFDEIPMMNKKVMMDNFNDMNTVNIDKEDAFDIGIKSEKTRDFTPKIGDISIGMSTGTSGNRGIFITSTKERGKWAGTILAKTIPSPFYKGYKVAFFMRANNNLYETVKSKIITFMFFDMFKDMNKNITDLNKFLPDILVAPPSVLIELAEQIKESKLNIKPIKIISIAEVLEEKDKESIKKYFSIDVIHQIYQCTEGFLACTCNKGNIHLNEELVKFEKEYISSNRFIPIITDFERKSQPIIRYRLNDILVESKEMCSCGSVTTVLEKIEGREDDTFIFKSKDDPNKDICVFSDYIRRMFLSLDEVSNYRVIELSRDNVVIQIDNVTGDVKKVIMKEMKELSDTFNFIIPNVEFSNYEKISNQKLRRIIRKFDK